MKIMYKLTTGSGPLLMLVRVCKLGSKAKTKATGRFEIASEEHLRNKGQEEIVIIIR